MYNSCMEGTFYKTLLVQIGSIFASALMAIFLASIQAILNSHGIECSASHEPVAMAGFGALSRVGITAVFIASTGKIV